MNIPKIFESEYQLCKILWAHEPIKSRDLALLCEEQLGWKKTTTYTVIKRLSDRGVLKNENTIVTSLVSKDQVGAYEIEELMDKKFNGSVPAFLLAFSENHKLSDADIEELQQMINEYKEKLVYGGYYKN